MKALLCKNLLLLLETFTKENYDILYVKQGTYSAYYRRVVDTKRNLGTNVA